MRFVLIALFAGLCACTVSSTPIDSNFALHQKEIWKLFKHINQPSLYKDHLQIVKSFSFYEHPELYKKPEVVEYLKQLWEYDAILPKGEIFSIFYEEHMKQAIALFKLFYYANDYETFYKTAVWARFHMNEGMFLYSFSVALIHRPDTYYFALPPIYEVYPHYFYSSETIQQAQMYKQMYPFEGGKFDKFTIRANYSGHYLNLHPEQSMSYFMEDVGVNSFYYYYNLYYPFWMDGEEFHLKNDNRGEIFFFMYQQILARFYLERLSNGFGEIPYFNWELPFETGYHPSLMYPNGLEFPTRPHFAKLSEYFYNYGQHWSFQSHYGYSYSLVDQYEKRILDAIDFGYAFTKKGEKVDLYSEEGLNELGNLIEGNPNSPYFKYYGAYQIFARHLLGYSYQPLDHHKIFPSVLEHFETSMRDPAFYQLYKKLIMYFMKYKYHLNPYKKQDLIYEGVHVNKVEFDRLVTYFDDYEADITNAIYVNPSEFGNVKMTVTQKRMDHKPFTYKVYVNSDKETDVLVKVFLGPKYDEYGRYMNLTYNWMNFVQFDNFNYKLKSGENCITRDSAKMFNYMHDRTTYYELYQQAFSAYDQSYPFQFDPNYFIYGFPKRFMLPKGKVDGMMYQIYVIVAPAKPYKTYLSEPIVGSGKYYVDSYPMAWPFDRPVYFEKMWFHLPNNYFQDIKIFHRKFEDTLVKV